MASSINASVSGAGGVITTADNTGILNLQTASTTAITIDASQNVGIGTASPGQRLDVSGSTTSDIYRLRSNQTAPSSTDAFIYRPADNTIALGTNSTQRMRIDSGGNVLINSTSSFGGKFQSTGVAASQAACSFKPGQNGDGTVEWYNASNGYVGAVTVNASTVVYGGTSDYRLKDNITPMTGALDKVSALKPVTYTWKATGEAGEGFIAHELQEVIPSAVVGEKDAVNQDGSIKPQEIDTSFLVATLTAAIQEQQTIINDLKARIETLEAK